MSVFDVLFSKHHDTTVLIRKDHQEVDGKMRGLCRKFTDEEWALLLFLPVDAYYMVATADGGLDHDVTVMFGKLLDGASMLPNQLLSNLMGDVASGGLSDLLKIVSCESQPEKSARMDRTKAILKNRLSPEQYQRLLGLVLVMAQQMAKAASGPAGSQKRQSLLSFTERYEADVESALTCTCVGRTAPSAANTTLETA